MPELADETNRASRPAAPVRVIVVDPDDNTRELVEIVISRIPNVLVVGCFRSIDVAIERIIECPVDLFVMDPVCLKNPAFDGARVLDNKAISTLLFNSSAPNATNMTLVRRSVVGIVQKSDGVGRLVEVLREVVQRLGSDDDIRNDRQNRTLKALSTRERETLNEIGSGYTAKETANRLGISAKTVETYKSRACQKLGLTTRADVVRFVSQGLDLARRHNKRSFN